MTTKTQLIAQCKAENPTMVQTINDVEITLSAAEYDAACEAWADMKLAQEVNEIAVANAANEKAALLSKLGITDAESSLLLG